MPDSDPSVTVEKALETARNVRLGQGVVSKTSYIAAAIVAVWGVVAWRWSTEITMDIGLLLIGIAVTLFGVWFIRGTQNYAERNPAQAMLEGAQLLEWHRMEVQAKGHPPVQDSPLIRDESQPASSAGDLR